MKSINVQDRTKIGFDELMVEAQRRMEAQGFRLKSADDMICYMISCTAAQFAREEIEAERLAAKIKAGRAAGPMTREEAEAFEREWDERPDTPFDRAHRLTNG